MFYERFIQLCDESNEKPTNVLKGIGVSSGNLNNWKNGTSVKSDILMHFQSILMYRWIISLEEQTNPIL